MRTQQVDTQNRAEEIRRRRVSRSQQRMNSVSSRAANPVQTRPVTVRGGGFGTPIHRQASTRPRRQYYVAMDSAAGSELRLPAIPVIRPGWRLLSGLLFIMAAIGVFSLMNSPFFRVYTVDVHGLERLSSTDLQAVLRLENMSIIEIQPERIHELVALSFPELADVQVSLALPNAVSITARERQPVLAWQMGDSTRWVDAEGYVFPARGDSSLPLVSISTDDEIPLAPLTAAEADQIEAMKAIDPLIAARASLYAAGGEAFPVTGAGINRKADLVLLNASLLLTQKLPEGTTIVYDKMNGLGWDDPNGWQVFVGRDLENFEVKFALYQSIANTLSERGIRPNLISVEHLNAPFYRTSGEQ